MRIPILIISLLLCTRSWAQSSQEIALPIAQKDWLIESSALIAKVDQDQKKLVLSNGLISRTIRLTPNAATVSIKNLVTSEEYIRSVKPEALVSIDGTSYPIGGLHGQKEHGYLKYEWLEEMQALNNAFRFHDVEIREINPTIDWKQTRWTPSTQWDRKGKEVIFTYTHPKPELSGISVEVHYEIYDHLPLLSKWIRVRNDGSYSIKINHFTSEIIAHPEKNNYVDIPARWDLPNLYLENDYAFGGFTYM